MFVSPIAYGICIFQSLCVGGGGGFFFPRLTLYYVMYLRSTHSSLIPSHDVEVNISSGLPSPSQPAKGRKNLHMVRFSFASFAFIWWSPRRFLNRMTNCVTKCKSGRLKGRARGQIKRQESIQSSCLVRLLRATFKK